MQDLTLINNKSNRTSICDKINSLIKSFVYLFDRFATRMFMAKFGLEEGEFSYAEF